MLPIFTIGYLPILDHLILPVADNKESTHFEHFILKTSCFSRWKDIAEALKQNSVVGAFLLAPLALKYIHEYKDSKIILLGHREGQVLVVSKSIKAVVDLRNKKIAIPDKYSTHHILLHKILASAGLTLRDVKVTTAFTNLRDLGDELATGSIDGFIAAEPMGTEVRRRKIGHTLKLSQDISRHHIDCVLVLKTEYIEKYMAACQELVSSLVKAGMFINAYPRQAAEIGEAYLGWSKKVLLEALTHDNGHILYWDLLPRVEDFEVIQKDAVQDLGLLSVFSLDKSIHPEFAQHAYREWMIETRKKIKDRGEERALPATVAEALPRFYHIMKTPVPTALVKIVALGEKYPFDITKIQEVKGSYSAFFKKVFAGQEFQVGSLHKNIKAFCFLCPNREVLPDRVFVQLNNEQAEQCCRALQFGQPNAGLITEYDNNKAEGMILGVKSSFMMLKQGDTVLCSFEATTFRFLTLLLSHYCNK